MSFWIVPESFSARDALFLAGDDEGGQDRQHRAVHGHRHAHPIERDAGEEDLHVLDAVDGDAGLADIADDAGMIAVVAAMGGEIEGDREAHLALAQILAEERVRFLGGREAGILAQGPRAGWHTWWRARRAYRAESPAGCRRLRAAPNPRRIERLQRDPLGRLPGERIGLLAAEFLCGQRLPIREGLFREIRHAPIIARFAAGGSARC